MSRFIEKETRFYGLDGLSIRFHFFDQWKPQMYKLWCIQFIEIGAEFHFGACTFRLKLLGLCVEIFVIYRKSDIPF